MLDQKRSAVKANIGRDPLSLDFERPATKVDPSGDTVVDPFGSAVTGTITGRIARSSIGPYALLDGSEGLIEHQMKIILTDYETEIKNNDILIAGTAKYKVLDVNVLRKFGGIVGYQSKLEEAN